MKQTTLEWLQLYRSQNVGPATFSNLLQRFGSAEMALREIPELVARTGGKRSIKLCSKAQAEKEVEVLQAFGADLLCGRDEAYPVALRHIPDAPPILTYIGHLSLLQRDSIAIVGARSASLNARRFAGFVAKDLGEEGYTITSGLARGIDGHAHEAALSTGTIAVIAGGINTQYPPENKELQVQICERGLLMAEAPFGAVPVARAFPKRNRIIAGLSRGTIVVEAALKSGTLITARLANEYGREVFAVPGFPTDPKSAGCNKLIRDGAHLIEGPRDVTSVLEQAGSNLEEPVRYGFLNEQVRTDERRRNDEAEVALAAEALKNLVGAAAIGVDELLSECEFSADIGHAALTDLELAGFIERLPGHRVTQILNPSV